MTTTEFYNEAEQAQSKIIDHMEVLAKTIQDLRIVKIGSSLKVSQELEEEIQKLVTEKRKISRAFMAISKKIDQEGEKLEN